MNGYVARHISYPNNERKEDLIATVELSQADIDSLANNWPCSSVYQIANGAEVKCDSEGLQRDCGHSAVGLQLFIEQLQSIVEQVPTRTIEHEEF